MTSIIKFQSLVGADGDVPYCSLLQIDEFSFLLDAGWDENFTEDYLSEVKKHVDHIDAVLLSFPSPAYVGALPYLFGKCGLACPVYATVPVFKMGQMFLYDLYQSRHNTEEFDVFSLDDVDTAFDRVVQLKYNQRMELKDTGRGLSITPLSAGHMLGGAVWKISKDGEEEIIYAPTLNHKKERHLNGCDLLQHVSRPSLFITDAYLLMLPPARRRQRDEQLMTIVLQTLRGGGNVLISIDTAGRVLELLLMLEQLWRSRDSGLMAYSLALLNNVSYNVLEFAKSQIEWMSDKLTRSFEAVRANPFQLRHVQLCHSLSDLSAVPSPKLVLASWPNLECGFARELFTQWCTSKKNHIILTSPPAAGSLAAELLAGQKRSVSLLVKQRVRLEGRELEEFRRREAETARARRLELAAGVDDSSDESEDEQTERDAASVVALQHDLYLPSGRQNPLFFRGGRRQQPMFPHHDERVRYDDYGEQLRPGEFVLADQNDSEMAGDGAVDAENAATSTGDSLADQTASVPSKCLSYYRTFALAAGVTLIDFDGRTDGESMLRLLEQAKPHSLLLTRASERTVKPLTVKLAQVCDKVLVAHSGHVVDATSETNIYQVRLRDALISSLEFARARDGCQVAWLDGVLRLTAEDESNGHDERGVAMETEGEPVVVGGNVGGVPTVDCLTCDDQVVPHSTVFINEVRLSDFKQVLVRSGLQSEFSGGVLWCCDGSVALRRQQQGHISIEGCLSDEYFRIRDLLYQQYAII